MHDLSEEQKTAVNSMVTPSTASIVLAGPGTGKTRVIAAAIAETKTRFQESQVLALTFSKEAASVMRERVEALLGSTDVRIATLHALGFSIIRDYFPLLGFDTAPSVLSTGEAFGLIHRAVGEDRALVEEIMSTMDSDFDRDVQEEEPDVSGPLDKVDSVVANYIRACKTRPNDVDRETDKGKLLYSIFKRYLRSTFERQSIDFDDMVPLAVHLLRHHPRLRRSYQCCWTHIFCDEFQDVSQAQLDLICLLHYKDTAVAFVGDPNQSIYSWRDSLPQGFQLAATAFQHARHLYLGQSYRLVSTLVDAAQAFMSTKHPLTSVKGTHVPIRLFKADHANTEASRAASLVHDLHASGTAYKDIAVLCRTRRQMTRLEQAMKKQHIPYSSQRESTPLHLNRQVLDMEAYLNLALGNLEDMFVKRVLTRPYHHLDSLVRSWVAKTASSRNISLWKACCFAVLPQSKLKEEYKAKVEGFIALIQKCQSISSKQNLVEALDTVVEETQYNSYLVSEFPFDHSFRQRCVIELRRFLQKSKKQSSEATLRQIRRLSTDEGQASHITLTTIHQGNCFSILFIRVAKGREWDHVLVCGWNEGLLPLLPSRSDSTDGKLRLDEEKRIAYVAITRSKQHLYLSFFDRDETGAVMVLQQKEFLIRIEPITVLGLVSDRFVQDSFLP